MRTGAGLRSVLRVAVVAALLYLAFRYLDLVAVASQLDVRLVLGILVSQPLVIASFVVFGWRLRKLLGPPPPRARRCFEAFALGIGLNLLLPARPSELSKPAYLLLMQKVALRRGLGAVVLEKLFDAIVIGSLAVGLVAVSTGLGNVNRVMPFVLLAAALLAWPAARLAERILAGFRQPQLQPLVDMLALIGRRTALYRRIEILALSIIGWMLSFSSLYVCIQVAGSLSLTVEQSLIVFVLTLIGGLIAVLPAGIGTFHAAAVLGLTQFGYGMEEAVLLSVALHLQALAFGFVYSLVVLATNDLKIRQLISVRHASERAP